jgi:hypothetical protein
MQPPSSPVRSAGPASRVSAEHLASMLRMADELTMEIDLGGSVAADRMAAGLLAALRAAVPELARERARGQALLRCAIDDVACQLEAAADRRGYWPLHGLGRSPLPHETQLRALVARLRLVAGN